MTKKLTVFGSINVDHIISVPYFARPGETLIGQHYQLAFGGKGANQAVAAARLGAQVNFIACIGNDDIGQAMKQYFAEQGINTEFILSQSNEKTGCAFIQVAENGENSIVISAGANAALDSASARGCEKAIAESSLLLLQLETPIGGIMTAIALAKKYGVKVMLNPAPACQLPDELLSQIDIITPNETETEILTGICVTNTQSAELAANCFHQKGIPLVLITLGKKGVYLSQNGKGSLIPGYHVNAIDTTAAGDTFNGALATMLLEDETISNAVDIAQAAAAISVTRKGAQPSIPTRQEVDQFVEKYSTFR